MRFAFSIFCLLIISCQKPQHNYQTSAIIGDGTFVSFDQIRHQLTAGLVEKTSGIGVLDQDCTVFHIGEGKVLTAAHCFADLKKAGHPCISNRIDWFDGSKSQCVQVLYRELDEFEDVAVIEVDPIPESSFSLSQPFTTYAEQPITVLGFPKDQDLKVSMNCRTVGERQASNRFEHNCDSLPGNSGSPILTDDTWDVIGVHNGHSDPFNYGTQISDWDQYQTSYLPILSERSEGQSSSHGPFKDNQSLVLHYFPSNDAEIVEVEIDLNVEDGYDFVYVVDGRGIKKELTGKKKVHLKLATPAIVSLESDYAGTSEKVSIHRLL